MPRFTLACMLLGLVPLAGCGEAEPRADGERLGEDEAPIINGAPDVTHQAVVAVLGANFECSGTILQIKNGDGYVLTAAHCCPAGNLPKHVVIGDDYQNGQSFNIVDGSAIADPCYQSCPGSTDDVCMLKFSGAPAGTPVIPPMTPATDALQVGTTITYVGYGITAPPPNGGNSTRRFVTKTIGALDDYFVTEADPAASGTCEGDSGGPGLVVVGGVEQIAAVTSFGDMTCTMEGVSIRTSAVYTGFIAPYLADTAASPSCPVSYDCQACLDIAESSQCSGDCVAPLTACLNDAACSALVTCYQGCGQQGCLDNCNSHHLDGLQKYEAIDACLCAGSCAMACQQDICLAPTCGTTPKSSPPACGTCVEDNCCAEAWACSIDAACKKCFAEATPAASCANDAAAVAYYQCTEAHCGGDGCSLLNPAANATTSASSSSSAASSSSGGTGGTGGAGGATASSSATGRATGGAGGGDVGQKSGCAVTAPRGDEPRAPVAALLVAAALAARRRRRR